MNKLIVILFLLATTPFSQAHNEDPEVDFSTCKEAMEQSVIDAKNMLVRDARLKPEQYAQIGVSDPLQIGWQYFKRWFYLDSDKGIQKVIIEFQFTRDDTGEKCEGVDIQDYVY